MSGRCPRGQGRDQGLLDPARKLLIGPSKTQGAVIRSSQGGNERGCLPWPWGWPPPPVGAICARPRRAMFVRAHLVRQSAQVARCAKWLAPAATSGRSCSAAWECLFLRLSLSQKKVPSVERFDSIPSAASKTQSSSMVMSQFSDHQRPRMRSPWGASFDFFQPPSTALIVPRCFQRCISFTTKRMLTSNCFAAAKREVPDSTTRTTRSRRSSE